MNKAEAAANKATVLAGISIATFMLFGILWHSTTTSSELIVYAALLASPVCGIASIVLTIISFCRGMTLRHLGPAIIPLVIAGLSTVYILLAITFFIWSLSICWKCRGDEPGYWIVQVHYWLTGWLN